MRYLVKEVQNVNSDREGKFIEAKDLTSAKKKASRGQSFYGTVLKVFGETGEMVAMKVGTSWR